MAALWSCISSRIANTAVQDDFGISPMPVRQSIIQQLEELSRSPLESSWSRQRLSLNLALASLSNFVGKADPTNGMAKLREAASMGSVTALAIHCRLCNFFDAEEALLSSLDPHSAMSELARQLMALPEDSDLSKWLRALADHRQRQAWKTKIQVSIGDRLLADGVLMADIPNCLERLTTLDVSRLTVSVVDQTEYLDEEENPCFESPLLLAVACRIGHLDIVRTLLGSKLQQQHQQQYGPSRELVASCLLQACRGGQIDVVEHIVRNAVDGLGPMLWPDNETGIHWLFMFQPDDQRKALDLMVEIDARHWHTDLLDKVPEPGIRLGLATVSGTPVEFATCVGATSTVEILVEKITWLQGQSRLGELSENTFRRALTSHMAAIVRTLLPLEIRRRRANRVDAALARLRLSQGKTEFESFGIFDVGRSVSSLSLALLHGSTEAVAKATDNTIDVLTRSGVAAINDIVSRHEMGHTPLADAVRWAPCSFDADVLAAFISRGANFGDMPQAVVLSRLVAPRPAGTKGLVMTKLLRAGLLNINPGLTLQAVQTGDAEIVGAILDHAPSGISANYALKEDDDATEITLLQAAALVPGGAELVQSLLDRGASIDETLGHLSPLELAIAKPSDAPIIDILIDRGASLKSSKYSTVIHFAASLSVAINGTHILSHLLGHPRVRAMLAALPTKSDEQQLSPVHMACFSANVAAIAALLEVGVELPHYNDTWDVLAISVFIGKRPHMNVLSPISEQDEDAIYDWKLKSERLILYLLDRLEPGHGRTPLHVACQVGNLRHVRQIIQEDIEALNAEDANGSLPVDFIEDANALEEQRLTREDVTEHTVANARRVYECVETALRDEIAASQRDMEHQFEATFKMLDLEQHDGTVSESSRGLMLDMTSESVDNSLSAAERVINSFWKVLEEAEAKTTDSALEVFVPSPGEGEEKALATLKQCETVVLDGYDGPEDILPKARSLLERKTQELGELHEDTLEAAEVVVDLLGILNKQEEVSEMVNQLLERRRLSLPEHDPRIFYTWRDRVIMLMNGGQNEDAVRETREAVAVAKRCWGSSHTAYLTFVPTLAALKCIEGKYDECVSMNMELLETLQAPEFQGRRGIGVRSEAVVHLCYHSMNKGDLDGIRRGIDGCLDCLGSADPKDFLARFDAAVSLARTAEQVNTGLANNMWTGLVQVCGSRLEPRSHCELEAQRHLAAHLMSREMFDDARVQYQKLIEDLTLRKGPKHLETLLVIVDDARALHKQRLTPAALQLLRPAVRELEKRHPSETNDEHSLRAKTLLAEMLLEQDNVDDWELVAREVASGYARLDRKSDAAVDAKRTLATTLGRTERAAEAVQIAQECLELTQEAYGENHERTLAVAGEVQLYLTRCGHWGDSVAMCERALAIAKAVCGESSTQVADWLYLLGTSLGLAEREGGLDKLLQSIDIALKLNDGVHSRSSLTSMWSAAVHMRQKTPTKALEVLTEALKACNDIITDEPHSLKVRIRTDIGRCHTDLKQYEDGFAHLEQAHRESRQLWGDSSRETISVVDSLVTVLSLLERYKEALPLAHEVLEYAESTAGSSDDETILAASSLADLYFALDKCSAAERLWEQALKGLAAQGEDADQDKVASCRHNHAQALIGILDFEAAKDLLALSFDHYSQAKGPGAKETLTVSITRAQVERLLENPAAAEAILLTVMEAARRAADLSEVLEHAEASLGGLWVKMGRYEDAEEVLSRAVERKGADFTARAQLCTAYKNQMKYEEAEEQAAILLSMVPEHLDEQAIEVELRLLRLYMDMGDSDHAQAWADTLFARMKGLNDYQGNPLDLLGALESLIEYFEQTQDEQRLFETRLIVSNSSSVSAFMLAFSFWYFFFTPLPLDLEPKLRLGPMLI